MPGIDTAAPRAHAEKWHGCGPFFIYASSPLPAVRLQASTSSQIAVDRRLRFGAATRTYLGGDAKRGRHGQAVARAHHVDAMALVAQDLRAEDDTRRHPAVSRVM